MMAYPVSVERLRYPRYLLQHVDHANTTLGIYYYPFSTKHELRKRYDKLTEEEKKISMCFQQLNI